MKKILVVEDDELLVKVLERLLMVSCFDVWSATDGESALELVRDARPDVVILDGRLPGMHGFELLRRLKELPELEHIPVIFLTAQDLEEDIVRALSMGATDYIVKPFKPKELVARVFRALGPIRAASGQ